MDQNIACELAAALPHGVPRGFSACSSWSTVQTWGLRRRDASDWKALRGFSGSVRPMISAGLPGNGLFPEISGWITRAEN